MRGPLLLLSLLSACCSARAEPVTLRAAKLADGFQFTEGPAADREGHVYFTDQPNDRILKWSTSGELTTFLQPSGRSNGLYFDSGGSLWACADEKNELWKIDPATGRHEVVLSGHDGKLFNGPNDLWIAPDGSVYFTDPLYKRPYWTHRDPEAQLPRAVYRLSPDRVLKVADIDVKQPNGIVGRADGKALFVADPGAKVTYRYEIAPDGTLANRRIFCRQGSDGMTLDSRGNLYLTGKGVQIYTPDGTLAGQIEVPENWTANVCFGGPDGQTLFITASTGLYTASALPQP